METAPNNIRRLYLGEKAVKYGIGVSRYMSSTGTSEPSVGEIISVARFLNSIPARINRLLAPIIIYKVEMLRLVWATPGIIDLLQDAPIMALLLCDARSRLQLSLHQIKNLVSGTRCEICKSLGGVGSQAELRLLLKIHFNAYNEDAITLAHKVIGNTVLLNSVKQIKLESIDQNLLELMLDYPKAFCCPAYLNAICEYSEVAVKSNESLCSLQALARTIDDILRIIRIGNHDNAMKKLIVCTRKNAVFRLHDQLCRFDHEQFPFIGDFEDGAKSLIDKPFGSPPIPGTEDVVPVKTFTELCDESRLMHNCAYSYAALIVSGNYYIYQIMEPERATLGIIKNHLKIWSVDQLKLACNREPATRTHAAVNIWMKGYCY